jgi:hypothetical protein
MPRIDPNDSKYDPGLPSDGEHICIVETAEASTSKKSGKPMLKINFKIVGHADSDRGKKVNFQYYMLDPDGDWKYVALIKAINPATPAHDPEILADRERFLIGKPFVGLVESYEESYNGNTYDKVRFSRHRCLSEEERAAFGSGKPKRDGVDEDLPF